MRKTKLLFSEIQIKKSLYNIDKTEVIFQASRGWLQNLASRSHLSLPGKTSTAQKQLEMVAQKRFIYELQDRRIQEKIKYPKCNRTVIAKAQCGIIWRQKQPFTKLANAF